MQREELHFDVLIIGAGPAGLSAAIRLKQLCQAQQTDLHIGIIEKGAEVGCHILSGAVFEPRALNELFPDWPARAAPLHTPATTDQFLYLSAQKAYRLPTPATLRNHGNYIISLGQLCRWLATQAESLGVEIYPGFAATEILYDDNNTVRGVATGNMGLAKDGTPSGRYQPGIALLAKYTLFAEGCRGSLAQQLIQHFNLNQNACPQTYGLGIKELWQVRPEGHQPGTVIHSVGWPLDTKTYGGGFLYHLNPNLVAVGFVVGLDYRNPYLDPFAEMQRFKTHPAIRATFAQGQRLCYGARALNEGGYQSLPKLSFPGGLLMGDAAGFLNVPKIKGSHLAMKSGMVAAETLFAALQADKTGELSEYTDNLKQTWLWQELYQARNIRPAFRYGLWAGLSYAAIDTYLLRGQAPWTFNNHADHTCLKPASACQPIDYGKPDNTLTFDKMSSVFISNTHHAEDQPCHLRLHDPNQAIAVNLKQYDAPEQRYCPAGVYEIIQDEKGERKLQINAQNCLHCKTCDIKDPTQNIKWTPPEGGGGPNYTEM